MNKIKPLIVLCFTLIILLCTQVTTFAHSGRTDSDGGHTNHSTGEYHWHHGYPAHQHEDRDGDGYLEFCPYRIQGGNNSTAESDCGLEGCTIAGSHRHINKQPSNADVTQPSTEKPNNADVTQPSTSDSPKAVNWKNIIGTVFALLIFSPLILSLCFLVWHRVLLPIKKSISSQRGSRIWRYHAITVVSVLVIVACIVIISLIL